MKVASVGLLALLIPIVAMIGGFTIAVVDIVRNSRLKELRVRERIAMIEKGLAPPPEQDPSAFDAWARRSDDGGWSGLSIHPSREAYATRCTRAGIILIGIGLMLMIIIGVGGKSAAAGVGVGGGIAVLGCAFLVCGLVERRTAPRLAAPEAPAPPPAASGQGENAG